MPLPEATVWELVELPAEPPPVPTSMRDARHASAAATVTARAKTTDLMVNTRLSRRRPRARA
jgi:hypothetical protein